MTERVDFWASSFPLQPETVPPPLKPSPAGGRWRVAPDEGQNLLALYALSGAPAPALPKGEPSRKVHH